MRRGANFAWSPLALGIGVVVIASTCILVVYQRRIGIVHVSGTIRPPDQYSADRVSGELLRIYSLDSEADVTFAKDLSTWFRNDENAGIGIIISKIMSRGLREERVRVEDGVYSCRLRAGTKVFLVGRKGYGWFEVISANSDMHVELGPSNATKGFGGR